jgi:hypothetical protein
MIRPLTNEENLQNLDNLPLSSLRPEFMTQVQQLRSHVLNHVRVKSLNGHAMSGAEWLSLV